MTAFEWVCPKCSTEEFGATEMHVSGGGLAGHLGVNNQRFAAISCTSCGYTEFYRMPLRRLTEVLRMAAQIR
ncbi:MAG: zinc ribbon domain-containing protein [Pseudomonadota bacterium]